MSQGHAGKKDDLSQNADYGNQGGGSSATTWSPAHDDRKSRWPQAQFVEPRRPDPCAGNRQDAAGNRRCMQGRSPQPCRRRACPAQAGGPHRRARWETLRHTVNQDGATGRALTTRSPPTPSSAGVARTERTEKTDKDPPACEGPFSSHVTRPWRGQSTANPSRKLTSV